MQRIPYQHSGRVWRMCICQNYSSNANDHPLQQRMTDLKRGAGGRSSFSGVVATVFGATGKLGRAVVNQLGKIGSQVIVPYRGDPYSVRELKLMGDLGQILFMPYHIEDEESIRKAVRHSNVVINCTGKFNQTSNFSFHKIHVDAPQRIARICREVGVEKFIHVSSMNCNENPRPLTLSHGSEFLRTKALGELAVRNEFPEAVIFRPSYMWSQRDNFLFYFTRRQRIHRMSNIVILPVWGKGKLTVKQPVCLSDVAHGIAVVAQNPECHSLTYQAVGPHRYRLDVLLTWIYEHMRYEKKNIHIVSFDTSIKLKVGFDEFIQPVNPAVSLERMEFEGHSDILAEDLPKLEDLGFNLTKLEDRIAWEVKPLRLYNYYWDAIGEFPVPDNPPLATN